MSDRHANPGRFALTTLGCKVNQYETQAVREQLEDAGWREVDSREKADLYVINTCVVTAHAADTSCKRIRRAARINPEATIVVTGCYVQADPDALREIEGVTHVLPKDGACHILEVLGTGHGPRNGSALDLRISRFAGHVRAFLKVQDGCDAFCSYCIVPYVRGRARSRPREAVVAEARRLVASGHKEIVLTGVHLGVYGRRTERQRAAECSAQGRGADLARLVRAVLDIRDLPRLRLSSIGAMEVSDELIDLMADDGRLCPHLHLSLQSGDDAILQAMNRPYTSSEYLRVLDRVRAKVPNPSFSTDVMVGFPGETEGQFARTLAVCRDAGFSRVHVFPFSLRPGTRAARMPGQIPHHVIRQREREALALADELALAYKRPFIGTRVEPLVETRRDRRTGLLCGYTPRYVKAVFAGPDEWMNRILRVQVHGAQASALTCGPVQALAAR